jgi:diguanylate cyclase (GGDEF)-like protein/putative nucleotidyltransferase with HDIG domain
MTETTRNYVAAVCLGGMITIALAASHWPGNDESRLLFFVVSAILMSSMKVALPRIDGTLSLGFLCVLISIVELPFAHAIAVGCASVLVQCHWRRRSRILLVQSLFNASTIAISTSISSLFYHWAGDGRGGFAKALVLVATASLYFVLNTTLVTKVISLTDGTPLKKVWQECYFWTFPYYIVGACAAGLIGVLTHQFGWQSCVLVMPLIVVMFRAYSEYLGRLEDEQKHVGDIAALHLRTIEALALAIAAKDQNTHEHLRRVQVYTVEIGKALGLEGNQLEAIRAAALLHDIGKLAVPEQILSKPGKLRPDEFEKVKTHPLVGAEILEEVEFPYPVAPIVLAHHEKWDGSGYPNGLKGAEIPIGARILSAVDCFDALASDRPYRAAMPMEEAMDRVAAESGISFDPAVVEILKNRYCEFEHLSRQPRPLKRLSTSVQVKKGLSPATGFEHSGAEAPGAGHLVSIASAAQEFRMLFEVAQEAGKSLSLKETFSVLAKRIGTMVPYDAFVLYVCRERLVVAEYATGTSSELLSSLRIPFGEGICGWSAANGLPVLNGNPALEQGVTANSFDCAALQSVLAVPLMGPQGTVAVLAAYRVQKEAFTTDQLRILTAVTSGVGPAIGNALKYRELEDFATTDELTGLPNSRALFPHLATELARAKRFSGRFAVLVCDLDGFKLVNDHYGHLAGNRVLQLFAKGVKECCGEFDFAARLGGDEFVVLFSGREEELTALIGRLENAARAAGLAVCGEPIVAVSIGHSFFPDHGLDAESILSEADEQMYRRKHQRLGDVRAKRAIARSSNLTVLRAPFDRTAVG